MALCATAVMAGVGYAMLGLLSPLAAIRFGAGPAAVGALVSVGFLLPLLLAAVAGTWVDRFGARRMAALGFLLFALAALPMVLLPSWPSLVVAFALAQLGNLMYVVSSQALVAEVAEAGKRRDAAYGWWTTSIAAGQAVGPLVGGVLLDAAGVRWAFAVMGLSTAVSFAVVFMVRAQGATGGASAPLSLGMARRFLGDRVVGLAMLTSSAALWAMTVQTSFLPVHLELLAMPAAVIGALMSLRALVATLVRPWMPQLVAWLGGRERTVVLTLVAMGTGLVGVAAVASWWLLALFIVVFGLGFGLSQPVSIVMVADRVAAHERGAALGVRLTGNRLAQLLAPLAFAVVAERAGLPWFFVLHGLLVLAMAALLYLLSRRPDAAP